MNWSDVFAYQDGSLYWKVDTGTNKTKGRIAGVPSASKKWYGHVEYKNKKYAAHNIVWELHYGPIPETFTVDHINRKPDDNRIENLRLATRSQQCANTKKWSLSETASQWKGVCAWKKKGKWRLFVRGQYLGLFDCQHDAATAYNFFAVELFGEFACLNSTTQPWLDSLA